MYCDPRHYGKAVALKRGTELVGTAISAVGHESGSRYGSLRKHIKGSLPVVVIARVGTYIRAVPVRSGLKMQRIELESHVERALNLCRLRKIHSIAHRQIQARAAECFNNIHRFRIERISHIRFSILVGIEHDFQIGVGIVDRILTRALGVHVVHLQFHRQRVYRHFLPVGYLEFLGKRMVIRICAYHIVVIHLISVGLHNRAVLRERRKVALLENSVGGVGNSLYGIVSIAHTVIHPYSKRQLSDRSAACIGSLKHNIICARRGECDSRLFSRRIGKLRAAVYFPLIGIGIGSVIHHFNSLTTHNQRLPRKYGMQRVAYAYHHRRRQYFLCGAQREVIDSYIAVVDILRASPKGETIFRRSLRSETHLVSCPIRNSLICLFEKHLSVHVRRLLASGSKFERWGVDITRHIQIERHHIFLVLFHFEHRSVGYILAVGNDRR